MKHPVAGLVVLGVLPLLMLAACRPHRDGRTANYPMMPPAYDADAGAVERAPAPRSPAGGPAPAVSAQPGDVQL